MSPARREALIVAAVAAGAAAGGALVGALALQSQSGAAALLSTPLEDLAGRTRLLSEWRGRAVVCNFWATWCEPCREELPLLDTARRKHAGSGLDVVAIAVDNVRNVQNYVEPLRLGITFLVGGAATVDLMRRLGNTAGGLPFSVLLDAQGRVRERKLGAYTAPVLERQIAELLR